MPQSTFGIATRRHRSGSQKGQPGGHLAERVAAPVNAFCPRLLDVLKQIFFATPENTR